MEIARSALDKGKCSDWLDGVSNEFANPCNNLTRHNINNLFAQLY